MSRAVVVSERGADLYLVVFPNTGGKDLGDKNLSPIIRDLPHVGSTATHGPIAGLE